VTKNIISDWKQAMHDGVFLKEFFNVILFRMNQFWGTYRGYKQSYLLDNEVRERFYYPKGYVLKEEKKIGGREKVDYS
jgi:rhamnosyltransferase